MVRYVSVLERWRDHRLDLESDFKNFGGLPPRFFQGEFLILAALEMIMATLDDVLAKVADENTVEQSLATLLDGIVAERDALKAQVLELQTELTAAGQDTSKVQSILDALDSNESLLNASRRKLTGAVLTPGGTDSTSGGDTATDTVSGGNGSDTVVGSVGDDTTSGVDTATDTVSGGNADDSVSGGTGTDSVDAGVDTSTDTVAGGNADDTFSGGQGDDSVG